QNPYEHSGSGQPGAVPGGYGHVQPESRPTGPWQPTTSFPPATRPGPQASGPGQPPGPGQEHPTPQKSGRGLLVAGVNAALLLSGGLGCWVGASVAGSNGGTRLSSPIKLAQPESDAPDGTVE